MTTEQKQPQAGEWWIAPSGTIVRIVGTKINGQILYESDIGRSCHSAKAEWWSEWHHEPRCTGFNWVAPEPETFPQYWTTMDSQDSYVAYVRRINAGQFVIVKRDGTDGITCRWSEFDAKHRTRLTPEEAAALIVRPEPPAIDPGEGWELLPKRVLLIEGDQVLQTTGDWIDTNFVGDEANDACVYRRRKPPVEHLLSVPEETSRVKPAEPVIPKLTLAEARELALKTMSEIEETRRPVESIAQAVERTASYRVPDNRPARDVLRGVLEWLDPEDETSSTNVAAAVETIENWLEDNPEDSVGVVAIQGSEVTAEALDLPTVESPDRVPENRPAREVVMEIVKLLADSSMTDEESADMAFRIGNQWLDDNPEEPAPFATPFTNSRSGMGIRKEINPIMDCPQCGEFRGHGHECEPVESPDDWVTQDRVPARPGIDERRYHYSSGDISVWEDSACINWNRKVMNREPIGQSGGWVELRCRRRDLPAPPAPIEQERWFMWSDDRYPIAFVKRAGGKVFNLNVDGLFKTSDDWGPSYEEKLINGELIEVTEASAKAYLRRPRRKIIDPPAPQPKRTPVRLWILERYLDGRGAAIAVCQTQPDNDQEYIEVLHDADGFYVEGER